MWIPVQIGINFAGKFRATERYWEPRVLQEVLENAGVKLKI
jgi:hypothetical protein